ncbi:MAG: LytTR family DNA-binding domain-containing protein [Flavobacteriales bacterium]
MKLLIIEDEIPASTRLKKMIAAIDPGIQVLDVIDSVEDGMAWFRNFEAPDLVVTDIQLADGLSFEIFESNPVSVPLIFTTAFDNYAIKAFKVNGIDYLLKPIDQQELHRAINKARRAFRTPEFDLQALAAMIQNGAQRQFKERFMIKVGDQLRFVKTTDIAYFFSEDGYTHIVAASGEKHLIDFSLDQVEQMVNDEQFFRINRGTMVCIDQIAKVSNHFNSRLKLIMSPSKADFIVSRERVQAFRDWLDR